MIYKLSIRHKTLLRQYFRSHIDIFEVNLDSLYWDEELKKEYFQIIESIEFYEFYTLLAKELGISDIECSALLGEVGINI